jgi:hypothetical protein
MAKAIARIIIAGSLALVPSAAWATDDNLAMQLGSILGSEEFCGLEFDQASIQAFIEKRVSANDMDFIASLSLMTQGTRFENEKQLSASEKTARCTQVKRVARAYGFLKP